MVFASTMQSAIVLKGVEGRVESLQRPATLLLQGKLPQRHNELLQGATSL